MSTATDQKQEVVVRDDVWGITMTLESVKERKYGYVDPFKRRGSTWVRYPKKHTPNGPSFVSVFPDGESIIDNLLDRHDRPWHIWKPMVEKALREMGVEFEKLAWRQRYYCECPCSPGFVVVGTVGPGYDYHFTVR